MPKEKQEKAEKKPRQKKAKKDENAPKKGMTAFLHYVQAQREIYKNEHPELSHKEVISKLGELWKSLQAKDKEPYEEKARKDKEKYDKAKKEYEKTKVANATVSTGKRKGDSVEASEKKKKGN